MKTPIVDEQEFLFSEQIARDYRILRLLGEGGMGKVFLAEQVNVGSRQVALKILNRSCSESPELVRRFQNEAASAGRINHRNIVTIYESRITDDGQIYVAMEYIVGKTLATLVAEKDAVPLAEVVGITKQIAAGLAAAHRFGIVHRDIKPDNLMLTLEDGATVVKILDFGIARLSEDNLAMHKTQTGMLMGTPAYMSPEQAMGNTGDKIDSRSDTYSVGMVVYEMLTGTPVFEAGTLLEIVGKHVNDKPIPLSVRRPDLKIPDAVEQIILKALEKDPGKRHQSVIDFAKELEIAAVATRKFSTTPQRDTPTVYDSSLRGNESAAIRTFATPETLRLTEPSLMPDDAYRFREQGEAPTEQSRRYKRLWLLASALLLTVAIIAYFVTKEFGEKPTSTTQSTEQPAGVEPVILMEYRIKLEKPTAEFETLAEDNTVKSGEFFLFEVKLLAPGSLYLFSEHSTKNNGSWRWLNASRDTNAQADNLGTWIQIPDKDWIGIDDNAGIERYLLVYVPQGRTWSSMQRLGKIKLSGKRGVAEISGEIATDIMSYLKKEALQLNHSVERRANNVCFSLSGNDATNRVSFYEVFLHHQR